MISAERKKFGIVARARVTKPNPRLNNTVLVERPTGNGSACIGFTEDLVNFVGKVLPRGVADFDPAYLVVTENVERGKWLIQAEYFRDRVRVVLWEASAMPAWLKNTKYSRGQDAG